MYVHLCSTTLHLCAILQARNILSIVIITQVKVLSCGRIVSSSFWLRWVCLFEVDLVTVVTFQMGSFVPAQQATIGTVHTWYACSDRIVCPCIIV